MLDSAALCDFCKAPVLPGSDGVCAMCAAIAETVNAKRQTGALPPPPLSGPASRANGAPVVARSGPVQTCWVCDKPISGEQERHEHRPPDGGIVYVHVVCHAVWQKLRPVQ